MSWTRWLLLCEYDMKYHAIITKICFHSVSFNTNEHNKFHSFAFFQHWLPLQISAFGCIISQSCKGKTSLWHHVTGEYVFKFFILVVQAEQKKVLNPCCSGRMDGSPIVAIVSWRPIPPAVKKPEQHLNEAYAWLIIFWPTPESSMEPGGSGKRVATGPPIDRILADSSLNGRNSCIVCLA